MTTFKKFLVGSVAALAILGFAATANAAYTHTGTLKMGMTNSNVMSLQQTLNAGGFLVSTTGAGSPGMESMYFGAKTKAAVMSFQTAKGLTADGVVGLQTGTALAAMTGGSVTYPAGCSSTSGFSTTTGTPCSQTATLPAGCMSTSGYSPTTGAACNGNGGGSTGGALSGGAGSIDVTSTTSDVEGTVNEDQSNVKILGFKVKAQDSDASLTNVKVTFANTSTSVGSERLDHYADTVSVWMGSTKVGSANVSDFNRESDSPDTYSASIALSNAVVRENDTANFYIAIDAASAIDSSNTASQNDRGATLNVELNSIRYSDATGAILTESTSNNKDFDFDSSTANDQVDLKSSSNNPDDTTVQVDESNNTDDVLALAYKLDVDSNSDDVSINSLPVHLVVANGGSNADSIDNIVDSVNVNIGGKTYEADLNTSGDHVTNGTGYADYTVDLDGDNVSINSGDISEVKVYITFNDEGNSESNYAEDTVVTASVVANDIDAETSNDNIDIGGASGETGADLTLNTAAADVNVTSADSNSNNDGTTGTFTFKFTVDANNGDVAVNLTNTDSTILGGTATGTESIVNLDGDADVVGANSFTVQDGDSNTFAYTVTITPASSGENGSYYVRLDHAAGNTVSNETAGPETLAN